VREVQLRPSAAKAARNRWQTAAMAATKEQQHTQHGDHEIQHPKLHDSVKRCL
jgi:hypothetical protein